VGLHQRRYEDKKGTNLLKAGGELQKLQKASPREELFQKGGVNMLEPFSQEEKEKKS